MFSHRNFVFLTLFLSAVLPWLPSAAQKLTFVETECGRDVTISKYANVTLIAVNVSFNAPQTSGASCSWVVPPANSTASSRILFAHTLDALACGTNAFTVSEWDPQVGDSVASHPIKLSCLELNPRAYDVVVARPGFALLVTLNTTSALPADFVVFVRLPPTSFADLCPETGRKTFNATRGEYGDDTNGKFSVLGRIPDYMTCRWGFQSHFSQDVLKLRLKSFRSPDSGTCAGKDTLTIRDEGGEYFMISGEETASINSTITIPYCKDQGIDYVHTGLTGKVFVTLQTDDTGGAFNGLVITYWSQDSCPSSAPLLTSSPGQEGVIKGVSWDPHQTTKWCTWRIWSPARSVVKLTALRRDSNLQQHCDESQDYIELNDAGRRNVSLCSSDLDEVMPIWSQERGLQVTYHWVRPAVVKSFLLYYTAVPKGRCQGHPNKKTVGSRAESVELHPIPAGDVSEGRVCQWLFTAQDRDHVVQVEISHVTSNADSLGVSFNKDHCSYDNFSIYSGDTTDNQTQINATCTNTPQGGSVIRYTSSSRLMLFVFHRNPDVKEPGFVMAVRQVRDPATSGGRGGNEMKNGWKTVLLFFSVVLALKLI